MHHSISLGEVSTHLFECMSFFTLLGNQYKSLIIGHWSLVIGHWSLVIGYWSLVIEEIDRASNHTSGLLSVWMDSGALP
jgi:hypothetical protein